MYLLYSAMLAAALVASLPYWLARMARAGKYREGVWERLGRVPARLCASGANEDCIWLHAVSVGEVLAVSGLVEAMKARFPGWRVVVSTTTATGQKLARARFGEENVFYFPLDFKFALRPYFARVNPRLVVVAETEFWPNFLSLARRRGARVAVVNARISDRSLPRYRMVRGLLKRVLGNVDLLLAQSEIDRERLLAIGADARRVQVSGNLKFDVTAPPELEIVRRLRAAIAEGTPVIVAGSTVEGEEEMLFRAMEKVHERRAEALLVLAPRHPERFGLVVDAVPFSLKLWRRTDWLGQKLAGGVFLLDSIGELASVYALATIAFVGGSLAPRGGHNILEPAQFGKAIVVGRHMENFRDISETFKRADALAVVSEETLAGTLIELMEDAEAREYLGSGARRVFAANAGATRRTLDALEVLLWMPETMRGGYREGGKR